MPEIKTPQENPYASLEAILSVLPHRYPFLLIDRILENDPGNSITALKNVTMNEPWVQGHFPGEPIFPGVLLLEAMAQAGAFLIKDVFEEKVRIFMITGFDNVKLRKPVIPGDQLIITVTKLKTRGLIFKGKAIAMVNDVKVAEAELTGTAAT